MGGAALALGGCATQYRPVVAAINGAALGGTLGEAAWRTRPTFYLVGDEDHAIPRVEQERMAARTSSRV